MLAMPFVLLALILFCLPACSPTETVPPGPADAEPRMAEDQDLQPKDGEEALEWLLEGNLRFVEGRMRHDHESMRRVAMLDKGQHPFAVVLGCADSRVSPELVFDHGLGDLFVIRVAGNVVADDEAGSIEYAALHLPTKIVVVLGHESCGAVTAATHAIDEEPAELQALIKRIHPALSDLPAGLEGEEKVHAGVEANVRYSVRRLRTILERAQPVARKRPLLVGAVYDTHTGRVRVLDC